MPAADIQVIKIANSGPPRIACAETLALDEQNAKMQRFAISWRRMRNSLPTMEKRVSRFQPGCACRSCNAWMIVGQDGEKAAAAPIPLPQNRTKRPQSHRSGGIVGQKWRYTTRMAHNDENSPAACRAKSDKSPQPRRCCGPLTRMTHDQAPDRAPSGGTRLTRIRLGKWQRVAQIKQIKRAGRPAKGRPARG